MAALTREDIQSLIQAAVHAVLAGRGSSERARLDERYFRRIDKLDGQNWKEFAFQFKTAVGSVNRWARDQLEGIHKAGKDVDLDDFFMN